VQIWRSAGRLRCLYLTCAQERDERGATMTGVRCAKKTDWHSISREGGSARPRPLHHGQMPGASSRGPSSVHELAQGWAHILSEAAQTTGVQKRKERGAQYSGTRTVDGWCSVELVYSRRLFLLFINVLQPQNLIARVKAMELLTEGALVIRIELRHCNRHHAGS
jgi:hypothetical protein